MQDPLIRVLSQHLHCFLLDLRPWLEGSYKIGSVHLSVSFLRIGLLVFSETWHGYRAPYIVVRDSWIFCKKSPLGKNDQKWSKMAQNHGFFALFKKVTSLVLSEICVKWKFLWFINILRKLHAWEKSGSQVIAKNGSQPVRFQYSLIVSISVID